VKKQNDGFKGILGQSRIGISVVDVVSILTEQSDYRGATKYWNTTKIV